MKKILFIISLLISLLSTKAATTEDYIYVSSLQYDGSKYYFDVALEGNTLYTAYGLDIQLPENMTFATKRGGTPNIEIKDKDIMYTDEEGDTEHTLSPSFPRAEDTSHARVACYSAGNYLMGAKSGILFRAYVQVSNNSSWPLGAVKVYDVELTIDKDHYYEAPNKETIVAMHTGETTLPFNISALNKWSTCILPFSAAIPEGVKAYTCSRNDEQYIYLAEVESMEAYKPYVLYSENGYSGTISGTVAESGYPETSVISNGYLCGAIAPQTATKGYIMQKQNDAVKFYAIDENDSFTIPAGKCWLNIPESTTAKSLSFYTEDMSTGVKATTILPNSNISYDLLGRQQLVGKHGILIMNGTKILK